MSKPTFDPVVPMDKGLLSFSNTVANTEKEIDHSSTLAASGERFLGKETIMNQQLYTLDQRPDLSDAIERLSIQSWPAFLLKSAPIQEWHVLFDVFAKFQLLLCDSSDQLIAVGHIVPSLWDGNVATLPRTITEILARAQQTYLQQQTPNIFVAVAAMVDPAHHGRNLSRMLVEEMKSTARRHACDSLLIPVRPTWKSRYPLTPMERYVEWRRPDGAYFDPWLRVHGRLGAEGLDVIPKAETIEGSVKEWEEWTGMVFPDSGSYIVPGALQPVRIDCERNRGLYEEPNYWMKHSTR